MNESEFLGPIRTLTNRWLGGLANGLDIQGVRTVHLKFRCKDYIMTVVSSAYYVPKTTLRLISPHRLFCISKGESGKIIVEEYNCTLSFDGVGELVTDYDSRSHLPTNLAKNHTPVQVELSSNVHLTEVLIDDNTNLSPARKLLVH